MEQDKSKKDLNPNKLVDQKGSELLRQLWQRPLSKKVRTSDDIYSYRGKYLHTKLESVEVDTYGITRNFENVIKIFPHINNKTVTIVYKDPVEDEYRFATYDRDKSQIRFTYKFT